MLEPPAIAWTRCDLIEAVPGKVSGVPVLKGTRLPVSAILDNYDDGLEPDEIVELFVVAAEDVRAILAFREEQLASPVGR